MNHTHGRCGGTYNALQRRSLFLSFVVVAVVVLVRFQRNRREGISPEFLLFSSFSGIVGAVATVTGRFKSRFIRRLQQQQQQRQWYEHEFARGKNRK